MDVIDGKFEDWWQKIVFDNSFTQAKDYSQAAFRAGYKSATSYADGMNLYGAIISLQEARRWLEAGSLENAKFDIELATKQLQEIADKKP